MSFSFFILVSNFQVCCVWTLISKAILKHIKSEGKKKKPEGVCFGKDCSWGLASSLQGLQLRGSWRKTRSERKSFVRGKLWLTPAGLLPPGWRMHRLHTQGSSPAASWNRQDGVAGRGAVGSSLLHYKRKVPTPNLLPAPPYSRALPAPVSQVASRSRELLALCVILNLHPVSFCPTYLVLLFLVTVEPDL